MTYIICFIVFLSFVLLMAIGVLFKRRAIRGSCCGLVDIEIEKECNCAEACDYHQPVLYQIREPQKAMPLNPKLDDRD